MIAVINLSKLCRWYNWYYSLILSEDITILAINSYRVNLNKGNGKTLRAIPKISRKARKYHIDNHILYISIQVLLQTAQQFQKQDYENDDNPETMLDFSLSQRI